MMGEGDWCREGCDDGVGGASAKHSVLRCA